MRYSTFSKFNNIIQSYLKLKSFFKDVLCTLIAVRFIAKYIRLYNALVSLQCVEFQSDYDFTIILCLPRFNLIDECLNFSSKDLQG